VFTIALTAMLITMFIVPPDNEYYGYFDVKTLVCLFFDELLFLAMD
jgi:hypothetical protein